MGKIARAHHDKIGVLVEQKRISPDTKYFSWNTKDHFGVL
jgi:hypothetical protein